MTSTPCKLDLLSLPPEILEEIVTEIPSRNTLLALSKSSRSLAALIIPHHLNFCVIRAHIFRSHLWERLARDGLHAANSSREREEAGWPIARTQAASVAEIETTLVSALQRMVRLNEFAWYHVPSPVLTGENDIWSTLQRLGTVRNLDILDMPVTANSDGSKRGIIFSDSFLRLSGLTTLKLHSTALNLDVEPDVTPLTDMLEHNCPDLEELALGRMMPGCPWEEFGQMLHGTEGGGEEKPILLRLKILQCSSAQASALLMRPIEALEMLSGVEVHDTIKLRDYFDWDDEWAGDHAEDHEEDDSIPIPSRWKTQFLARLRACPSIRHLSLICSIDTRQLDILAMATPHLTRLDVTGDASGLPRDIDEWCAVYTLFPSLQTIAASHLIDLSPFIDLNYFTDLNLFTDLNSFTDLDPRYFQDKKQKNNDHIQRLARACPRLKVLVDRDWKVIITSREEGKDGGNVRWVVRKLNESKEGEVIYGF
ncbi:hypothetical protein EW146_g9353 [Bondarzewia mesenterica]|uniref:F-box domain-containing protein n=1 Tax=Bondarzewia mesenterica TaxID=1095465 RepID=A0A4S4L8K0_9AGAM|nr:hypothetical protein EW146_g9353 [Bondarzewia mesenterica]